MTPKNGYELRGVSRTLPGVWEFSFRTYLSSFVVVEIPQNLPFLVFSGNFVLFFVLFQLNSHSHPCWLLMTKPNPRPRPRPHHLRPRQRPRPDHSKARPYLPRPRPNIFLHGKHNFLLESTTNRVRTLWRILLFFHASYFGRSRGLDRVVSSETKTFELQDRGETETFVWYETET